MALLYFDSVAIIDALEKDGPGPFLLREIILNPEQLPYALLCSELALAEVLVHPAGREQLPLLPVEMEAVASAEAWYLQHLAVDSATLRTVPITRAILLRAAILRKLHRGLKLPDAIHLATAFEERCTHLLTSDERLLAVETKQQVASGGIAVRFIRADPSGLSALMAELRP